MVAPAAPRPRAWKNGAHAGEFMCVKTWIHGHEHLGVNPREEMAICVLVRGADLCSALNLT